MLNINDNKCIQSKFIHIDSRNRSKKNSLLKNSSDIKLNNNPLLFTNNSDKIIVFHSGEHTFTTEMQIIIKNITADKDNLICNYPKKHLEYNSLTNNPIFQIIEIKDENYFIIKLSSDIIKLNTIKTGRSGGNDIIINVVGKNNLKLYEKPNNYKIEFDAIKQVVGMRLVSTEIPNVSYNIKQSGIGKNNCLYWVNENEGKYISDKIAVSDQIYLNSISKTNLINADADPNNYPTSPDKFQTNISTTVTNTINSSYSNITSYIHITKNKLSQFHTPANLFDTAHFLQNNYHLVGNTLVNYIRTNTTEHAKFKQYLPWEYNYFVKYNNGANYNTDINYVPDILGYQIFDIKQSTLNNLKFQEYVTSTSYINNNITPKTNSNGGSFLIEDINTEYSLVNTLTLKYPIHNLYLEEGIYNTIDDILNSINYKLNYNKKLNYSWKLRDWVEENKSNKFVKNHKNYFDIQLNKQTEIIEFRQYETLTNYSSLYNKPVGNEEVIQKKNISVYANEGLTEIAIKHKGHTLNTGNLLKMNTPQNVFNVSTDYLNNQEHIVKINPVYEIELRVIYPVLSKTYYGIHNNNLQNSNIPAYQINQSNLGNEFTIDNATKLLKDYFGNDNFKYLNKGSFQSMLKYIGSKLVNGGVNGVATNNENHNTKSSKLSIDGPENPFLENELIVKYDELQGDGNMILGRIQNTNNYNENGNITLQYECLTQVEKGNFKIGDFIIGMNSNCIAMIVPYNWGESKLPSKLELTSKISWKKQIQHANDNFVNSLDTDKYGNIYMIGYTEGNFGGTSAGDKDIIIVKYNSSGKLIWKKQFGSNQEDKGYSIKVDNECNIYILATSKGEIISGTSNVGNEDIYLAKYTENFNLLWEKQIATDDIDIGYSIELDSNNNVYFVGSSKGDLDAGGSEEHFGKEDVIVVKYNTNGDQQWIQQYGTGNTDISTSLVIDELDNIFFTGQTENDEGNFDIILFQLNSSNGEYVDQDILASVDNVGNDYGYGIDVDNLGFLYLCGYTSGNLISPLSPFSGNDIFITKFSIESKHQIWIRQIGSHLNDEVIQPKSLQVDNFGNILLSGHTKGNLETTNQDNTKNDIFLMKLNKDGEEIWKEQIGTNEDDINVSITNDLFGNIYVSGNTKGNLGLGKNLSKLGSGYDIFLLKLMDNEQQIKEIKNGSENIIVKTQNCVDETNLKGLTIPNLTLHKPIRFSILWGSENTLQKQLGFLNNKQGFSNEVDNNDIKIYEEDLDFKYVDSNTKDVNEVVVTRSTFFNFYNDSNNNYLLLECEKEVPYEIGDTVYLKNHKLNYYQQKKTKYRESIIQNVYPFSNWLYSMETETSATKQTIEKIKEGLYNNLSVIALDDESYLSKIVNQYYYTKQSVFKIYVQETHGDGFQSKAFQKNMLLYDDNNNNQLMGTVLGITKINTTTDQVYNEAKITDIEDIKKNSYYFIYFEKDSNYNFTSLQENDVVSFSNNKKQIESINTTTNVITIASHGFSNNECVIYEKVGTNGIGGLISGNHYFIINSSTNEFQLSLTNEGFTRNLQKSVLTLSSVTVSLGSGSITNGTYILIQSSTNGSGTGFKCSATFASNATTAITILNGGSNYVAGNTITFTNQNNETNSLVLTVGTVGDIETNNGIAIDLTAVDLDTAHLLDTLQRSITREASAIVKKFPTISQANIIQDGSNPNPSGANWTKTDSAGNSDGWTDANPPAYENDETASLVNQLTGDKLVANNQYSLSFTVGTATLNMSIGGGDLTGNTADEIYIPAKSYEVGTHHVLITPLANANYLWFTANTNSSGNGTIDNVTTIPNLYLDARYDYLYYFYFANKVIIDYKTEMTDREIEYLGNCGYLGNNQIDLNRDVDINYNVLPLNVIKSGESVYIYNHQKAVPKYFQELDVLDTNPKLIETIQNDYDESVVKTSVDETNNYTITGIKDGCYKALINLWPGKKSDPYSNYKYRPGKTMLIDLEWTKEVEEGYMNKGSMRTLNSSISIVGDNKKVANPAEISNVIVESLDTTINRKGASKILLSSSTGFTANSIVFINTKTFENNTESSYENIINEDTCEMNIVVSISENELTLKYPLINNHNYANTKVIQRYTTSFVTTSSANSGQKNIVIGNSEYGNFSVGDIIILDWNTKDANGNYLEEIHRIALKPGDNTLTVEENLQYTHTTNCCVVNLGNTTIRDTMLSTQNILIDNEWYTKIFYQGHDCIEPQGNEEYKTGVQCFHKYAKQTIYINGMNGIQIPDISLMTNRNTAYSEQNKIDNTSQIDTTLTQENFNITQIKPLTPGFYETYPNLIKDKVGLLTDYYNLSIPGNFTKKQQKFTSELVWNEKTTYQSADNLQYNCILVKGKYLGYGGKIEFREKTSILENPNGFKVLQKIKDQNQETTKLLIDLKISDINLNTNVTIEKQKMFHDLVSSNFVPSSILIDNYNTLQSKSFLKQDITIGTGGIVYTKQKNGAINLSGENYINLCFPSLGGKQSDQKQTIQQTSSNLNNNKNVFAKILLPEDSGNILFNTFISAPAIFQRPIDKLSDLIVKFVDNEGNEYDFQGKDHSFTLEVFYQVSIITN